MRSMIAVATIIVIACDQSMIAVTAITVITGYYYHGTEIAIAIAIVIAIVINAAWRRAF